MYNFCKIVIRFCLNQFFRDITVLGKHNIPKEGPVIFCGNHQNQFVDGSILFTTATRNVRFLVAAKV
jgi:glycerol-3-phosphate O-acyltransferase/dihydroxyacetone phosphate acyltransferase